MRQTYTYATLELSQAAYDEIAAKLKEADYGHAFMEDGTIDMHGIGVTPPAPAPNNEVKHHHVFGPRPSDTVVVLDEPILVPACPRPDRSET